MAEPNSPYEIEVLRGFRSAVEDCEILLTYDSEEDRLQRMDALGRLLGFFGGRMAEYLAMEMGMISDPVAAPRDPVHDLPVHLHAEDLKGMACDALPEAPREPGDNLGTSNINLVTCLFCQKIGKHKLGIIRTWKEWADYFGASIIDPDGFRDKPMDHLYTVEEYQARYPRCTVFVGPAKHDPARVTCPAPVGQPCSCSTVGAPMRTTRSQ